MGEAPLEKQQESQQYRKRRLLGPVETTVLLAAFLLFLTGLVGFYAKASERSYADQVSLLMKDWKYAQEHSIATDQISHMKKQLAKIKANNWGPFPAVWFPQLDGVSTKMKQIQDHTDKILAKATAIEKKKADKALVSLEKVEGSSFKNLQKQYQTAFHNATSPQDYADLRKKWMEERIHWIAAAKKLKKTSGGLLSGQPADILMERKQLDGLLKGLSSHPKDASKANNALKKTKAYFQLTPSQQLKQHDSLKQLLQSLIKKLTKDKAPKLLKVPLVNQLAEPELYNGCEVSSLAMILQYAGYDVTKTQLAKEIPKVPVTYKNGLKGNPNFGFVGDIDGSKPGYFVYHGPIAALAKKYAGERVEDLTGSDISKIYEKVAEGIPVWVITTTSFAPVSNMKTWNTPHGKVKISLDEHSVVLTGYSKKYVWVNNPYGKKNEKINRNKFEKSWVEMGRQAVVINP